MMFVRDFRKFFDKLDRNGARWFMKRTVRELIRPSTFLGRRLPVPSSWTYRVFSQPMDRAVSLIKKSQQAETLYYFYDLDVEPITYDFIWALCVANAKKKELNLKYLHVLLVPGEYLGMRRELYDYDKIVNHDSRHWRIASILLSGIRLLSESVGVTLCETRSQAIAIMRQAKHRYPFEYNTTFPIPHAPELVTQYGVTVRALRAEAEALKYVSAWLNQNALNKKMVVITLRHYDYVPERNSDTVSWANAACEIEKKGFFVVFVPDLEDALQPKPKCLENFHFFSEACWNIQLRMALYELAYLNLGVNTGPMSLCWFSPKCRYITYKVAVKNVPSVPLSMIVDKGFKPNQNAPFAGNFQKWVWDDDTSAVIVREFYLMCEMIENQT